MAILSCCTAIRPARLISACPCITAIYRWGEWWRSSSILRRGRDGAHFYRCALRSVRRHEYALLARKRGGFAVGRQRPEAQYPLLVAIALGGIAFEAPPGQTRGRAAPNNARFYLAADKAEAMRAPDGPPLRILLNFDQSLRGLARGAPVDFRGIALGEVESIGIDYAPGRKTVRMPVMIKIYPSRLRTRLHKKQPVPALQQRAQLLATLVKNGLRAQLRSGNLLT